MFIGKNYVKKNSKISKYLFDIFSQQIKNSQKYYKIKLTQFYLVHLQVSFKK